MHVKIHVILIERHHDFHHFLLDALARGNRQLFSLLACLGVVSNSFLSLTGAIATIHIVFNRFIVLFQVVNYLVLQGPLEEIQLTDRRFNKGAVLVRHADSVPSTKRIKTLLAIRLQLQLVIDIHFESTIIILPNCIGRVILLCIICCKPINYAQ